MKSVAYSSQKTTPATDWQIAVRGNMRLALRSVKSINADLLNQIRCLSIK